MALPSSGAISLSDVNVELGLSATAQISLGDAAVRALFGVASGAISIGNGYGKANQFSLIISSNQTNANLATLATAAGWNGTSKVVATINSGVILSSDTVGVSALTVDGSFPGGVELINNGSIIGKGGNGGTGGYAYFWGLSAGGAGGAGGTALSVSTPITITNNGTIGGGGGGGGGGGSNSAGNDWVSIQLTGGGGGGGRSGLTNSSGGSRGFGDQRSYPAYQLYYGGNGGAGTYGGAGGGGYASSAAFYSQTVYGGAGGSGGGWGQAGSSGTNPHWYYTAGGGGAGGAAVTGNSYISWGGNGTRYGAVS